MLADGNDVGEAVGSGVSEFEVAIGVAAESVGVGAIVGANVVSSVKVGVGDGGAVDAVGLGDAVSPPPTCFIVI